MQASYQRLSVTFSLLGIMLSTLSHAKSTAPPANFKPYINCTDAQRRNYAAYIKSNGPTKYPSLAISINGIFYTITNIGWERCPKCFYFTIINHPELAMCGFAGPSESYCRLKSNTDITIQLSCR
jgi:hypothetical protein